MEKDFTIAKVGWLTQCKGNEDRRGAILRHFTVFVQFLQENNLLSKPLLLNGQVPDDEFAIRKSHLTDEGFEVVRKGYDKWLQKVDKGRDPSDVTILEKALEKVRGTK